MENRPKFTDEDAAAFAAEVAKHLPPNVETRGATFDLGYKMGVAVMLPNGRRHAVRVTEEVSAERTALALGLWIEDQAA